MKYTFGGFYSIKKLISVKIKEEHIVKLNKNSLKNHIENFDFLANKARIASLKVASFM